MGSFIGLNLKVYQRRCLGEESLGEAKSPLNERRLGNVGCYPYRSTRRDRELNTRAFLGDTKRVRGLSWNAPARA